MIIIANKIIFGKKSKSVGFADAFESGELLLVLAVVLAAVIALLFLLDLLILLIGLILHGVHLLPGH